MKRYVIITPSLVGMGGAQMYVRNKCQYMQNNGWSVDIISALSGKVYIEDVKKYDFLLPELLFPHYCYTNRKQKCVLQKCINRICNQNYDEIIIESTSLTSAMWAEVIASKCNARHIFFTLQEQNKITSEIGKQFVIFKHNRREMAGITPGLLYDMFAPFSPIEKSNSYSLPAYCTNTVEDIDCHLLDNYRFDKYDFIIGCFARLDKPFIMPALKSILDFAKLYSEKQILLIMIGGAKDSLYERKIRKLVRAAKNIDLYITGFIFPVPAKMFEDLDVLLSTAGCAGIGKRSGVPTVSFDGRDYKPIGIMGRTTEHSLYRDENEPPLNCVDLMKDILIEKKYGRQTANFDIFIDFSKHEEFISQMASNRKYFNFSACNFSKSDKYLALKIRITGPRIYRWLNKMKRTFSV